MLSTLWRNTTDGLPDLAPARTRSSARCGCFLAQPIGGPTELIGELQRGQSCLDPVRHTGDGFFSPAFDEPLNQCFEFGSHAPSLSSPPACLNHVLTTMC